MAREPQPSLLPDYYTADVAKAFDYAFRRQLAKLPLEDLGNMFDSERASMAFMRHALQFLGCEPLWAQPSGAGIVARNGFYPEYLFAHDGYLYGNGGSTAWGLARIDPRTGDVRLMGVLTGSRVGFTVRGAAVVRGVPYILSRQGRNLYLARVDMGAMTATNVGAITGSGFGHAQSLVSDGYTLWMVSGTTLFAIDTATAAATAVRTVGGITLAAGGQAARQPPAAAFYNGEILAFYSTDTGAYRFAPSAGDATRLSLAPLYDCAEYLDGAIYAQAGGYLYRVDPETGGHDDFFDLAYHRRVLQGGRWWIRNIGFPQALRRYMNDVLRVGYSETVRYSPGGRPVGVSINLLPQTPRASAAAQTPRVLDALGKRIVPYLIGDLVQVDSVRSLAPIATTMRYGAATMATRFAFDR